MSRRKAAGSISVESRRTSSAPSPLKHQREHAIASFNSGAIIMD
jgi:hypothetical protein